MMEGRWAGAARSLACRTPLGHPPPQPWFLMRLVYDGGVMKGRWGGDVERGPPQITFLCRLVCDGGVI